MEITAALAADLAILTQALDATEADIAEALRRLVADAKLAVRSYLGLTVIAGDDSLPLTVTAMEETAHVDDVVSSLLIPLSDASAGGDGVPVVVILYAAGPGAFVDLAADLSWLTGRHLTDFTLDGHLSLPAEPLLDGTVRGMSLINQAIGVLIADGYTPEQALIEIDARAAASGHGRADAAGVILDGPPDDDLDEVGSGR